VSDESVLDLDGVTKVYGEQPPVQRPPRVSLKTMKKHLVSTFILIVYITILIKVMVFKDMPTIRIGSLMLNFAGTDEGHPANFVPFKTILQYLLGDKGLIIAGANLVGNIALLVPIGFLVPFVYRNMTWKKSLALAAAAGLAIEGMQVVLRVGIFDIDDVVLNALGVMIGYWTFAILAKWVRSKNYNNDLCSGTGWHRKDHQCGK
jgi:glycopeptide antibiotics resistance protein